MPRLLQKGCSKPFHAKNFRVPLAFRFLWNGTFTRHTGMHHVPKEFLFRCGEIDSGGRNPLDLNTFFHGILADLIIIQGVIASRIL